MKKTLLGLGIAAALLAGCAKKQQPVAAAAPKPAPSPVATTSAAAVAPMPLTASLPLPGQVAASAPQIVNAAPPAVAPLNGVITGKVVETMNAANYTYVKLKTSAGDIWAAVPQTKLSTGATVTILGNMTAENFESKTLKRKFDRLVFGNVVQPGNAPAAMPAASAGNPVPHPGTLLNGQKVELANIKVDKASAADAKSVAELWAAKSLKDAPVTVRGKVVKFLPDIMGRNWLHLRDGSGTNQAGDNDLTITTKDVVKVGDVVTVKGIVRRDKDFGAGYTYTVIVEDASISQ